MKSDTQLRKDVIAELNWDPAVAADAVGVAVKDGVVTLSGHLGTYIEKAAVQRALRRVAGVKAIALELDVRLAPDHHRSDTDIATAAQTVLRANASVPAGRIRLIVDKGWITMQGDVDWDYQRRSAEHALRPLAGVVGINNEVEIKTPVASSNVERGIREALARQAEREAKHIEIQVDGSTVRLRGRVHSWQERDAAQGAAWSAPGVRTVLNELMIG